MKKRITIVKEGCLQKKKEEKNDSIGIKFPFYGCNLFFKPL